MIASLEAPEGSPMMTAFMSYPLLAAALFRKEPGRWLARSVTIGSDRRQLLAPRGAQYYKYSLCHGPTPPRHGPVLLFPSESGTKSYGGFPAGRINGLYEMGDQEPKGRDGKEKQNAGNHRSPNCNHDADECHDETILRIYGGHIVRVPYSLEEVISWLGL